MNNSSETRSQYMRRYNNICNVVSSLYGDFEGDFISVKDTTEKEVRENICKNLSEEMNCNDVERYVYITAINGTTIIKR